MDTLLGIVLVMLAGLGTGTGIWPMKLMKRLEFEHYWFVAMLVGLFIVPWAVVLASVPHPFEAYARVGWGTLVKANLFGLGWGIANVLYGLCVVRIGAALTGAIMTGLGVIAGTTLPMVMKGTGLFSDAPDLSSPSGRLIMIGLGVMLLGVMLCALAGFGRNKILKGNAEGLAATDMARKGRGGFIGGLVMTIIAGMISAGIALCFVYAQGPIVEEMKAQGAGDIVANISVWAAALLSGAAVNILYPAWLMTRKKNWGVLLNNTPEALLAVVIGLQFILAVNLMGRGMLLLGVLGASVGFAIQQTMQIMGNQAVGFFSGEWQGICGRPRTRMYLSLAVLVVAVTIMAWSNTLGK